jgi:SpoVK/Ycf46/Vps4 family AAA+-type ATPase
MNQDNKKQELDDLINIVADAWYDCGRDGDRDNTAASIKNLKNHIEKALEESYQKGREDIIKNIADFMDAQMEKKPSLIGSPDFIALIHQLKEQSNE